MEQEETAQPVAFRQTSFTLFLHLIIASTLAKSKLTAISQLKVTFSNKAIRHSLQNVCK